MKTMLGNKLCVRTLVTKIKQTKNCLISTKKSLHLDDEKNFFSNAFYLFLSYFPWGRGTLLFPFFTWGKYRVNCSGATQNDT